MNKQLRYLFTSSVLGVIAGFLGAYGAYWLVPERPVHETGLFVGEVTNVDVSEGTFTIERSNRGESFALTMHVTGKTDMARRHVLRESGVVTGFTDEPFERIEALIPGSHTQVIYAIRPENGRLEAVQVVVGELLPID